MSVQIQGTEKNVIGKIFNQSKQGKKREENTERKRARNVKPSLRQKKGSLIFCDSRGHKLPAQYIFLEARDRLQGKKCPTGSLPHYRTPDKLQDDSEINCENQNFKNKKIRKL